MNIPSQKQRIVIFATKTGGGHWSPAVAIADEISRLAGDQFTVDVVDGLYGKSGLGLVVERGYSLLIRRAPILWGSFFTLTNRRLTFRVSNTFLYRLTKKLRYTLFGNIPPVAVVCTNSVLLRPVAKVLKEEYADIPLFSVVTDLVTVHRAWINPSLSLVFSPSPMATRALIRLGQPPDKIRETGLPVSREFQPVDGDQKRLLREQLGLDPLKPLVLLMNGAEGHKRLFRISVLLEEKFGDSIQQIVVCGKNASLKKKFEERRMGRHVSVYGFIKNVCSFMKASDIVVTKSGSLTVSEALACGSPLVITETLPGQESGTPEWLVASGAAAVAHGTDELLVEIEKLIRNPELRQEYSLHARTLGRPDAARAAAEAILELSLSKTLVANETYRHENKIVSVSQGGSRLGATRRIYEEN